MKTRTIRTLSGKVIEEFIAENEADRRLIEEEEIKAGIFRTDSFGDDPEGAALAAAGMARKHRGAA